MSEKQPTMQLVTRTLSVEHNVKTFVLIPVSKDCPYVEGLYNPYHQHLILFGKETIQQMHMFDKLDAVGQKIPLKGVSKAKASVGQEQETSPFEQERRVMDTHMEYHITEKEEIIELVKMLAINAESYQFEQHIKSTDIQVSSPQKIEIIKP